jgi:hypothetical protein
MYENLGRRPEHACDQNAQCDVIERVSENVHGVVPAMPKVVCFVA